LQELITVVVNEHGEIINRNIKLAYIPKDERGSKSILVEADRGRISQVFSNLLSNAIKFTDQGSVIVTTEINDSDNKNAIIVRVKDSGVGIDSEILPKLFAKFVSNPFKVLD
jgi:signal transduction histidine kinase